jgi:hypothetical protein
VIALGFQVGAEIKVIRLKSEKCEENDDAAFAGNACHLRISVRE